MKTFFSWLSYGAWLVGWPVMILLIVYGLQTSVFTLGCAAAGWKCEHALAVAQK